MAKQSQRNKFTCSTPGCGKQFTKSKYLKRHEKIHLPLEKRTTYPCQHCDRRFVSRENLEYHTKRQHAESVEDDLPILHCSKCNRGFNSKRNLKQHQATHVAVEDREIFDCDRCQKKYFNKRDLIRHKKEGHAAVMQTFLCTKKLCTSIFSSARCLKAHLKSVHDPQKKKGFICYYCSKTFTRLINLKYHLNIHLNQKPFNCNDCGEGFHSPWALHSHRKVHHLKRKILRCPHCKSTYLSPQALRNHLAVVRKEGLKFKCGFCKIGFLNQRTLEVHTRKIHTKEKPFKCVSCEYRTVAASTLYSHFKRRHNRVRCYFCGNSYPYLSNHMSTHTKEWIYKCKFCPKRSGSSKNVNIHMHKIHGYKTWSAFLLASLEGN